ncbi:hypothetical protein SDC9_177374 [bioreactor metagenome]|uniref:Uncharacterized protein n=1 Tax=bioreactor metagenome TaxID=1076179 RepID=A0A645GVY5_9ZZZZ
MLWVASSTVNGSEFELTSFACEDSSDDSEVSVSCAGAAESVADLGVKPQLDKPNKIHEESARHRRSLAHEKNLLLI